MKRNLYFLLTFLFGLFFPSSVWGCGCGSAVPAVSPAANYLPTSAAEESSEILLFTDAAASQKKSIFVPLESVFVRLNSDNSGSLGAELSILNNQQRVLDKLALERLGSGPYTFTGSFLAPEPPGPYQLKVLLSDDKGLFSRSKNFMVIADDDQEAGRSAKTSDEVEEIRLSDSQTPVAVNTRYWPGLFGFFWQMISGFFRSVLASFKV